MSTTSDLTIPADRGPARSLERIFVILDTRLNHDSLQSTKAALCDLLDEVYRQRSGMTADEVVAAGNPLDLPFAPVLYEYEAGVKRYAMFLRDSGHLPESADHALSDLRSLSLVEWEYIQEIYLYADGPSHPVRQYIDAVDLLRCLLIEHIERFGDRITVHSNG